MAKSRNKVRLTAGGDPNYRYQKPSSKKKNTKKKSSKKKNVSKPAKKKGQDPLAKLYQSDIERERLDRNKSNPSKKKTARASSKSNPTNKKTAKGSSKSNKVNPHSKNISQKPLSQRMQVFNLFVNNGNNPLSNLEIAEKANIISHNVRRITGESTKRGHMVRVDRGVYKLSEGEYENMQKVKSFGSTKLKDKDGSEVIYITKIIVDKLTTKDIDKALKIAEPKYYKDKNRISDKYEEYINIEFVLNNNYYLQKVFDNKGKTKLRYEFSGRYKHNFLKGKSKPVNGKSKKYWIPLFPVFVYILKNSTDKSLRQEYNLESYEYFLSHLNLIYKDLEILSSIQLANSLSYKIFHNYINLFDNTIKNEIQIEKELRLKIWNDVKDVYKNKNLTTREEWNNHIYDNYNIYLHRTDRGIYREARRTTTITKDDVGLAFSVHSIPGGPYNDKVDDYGMVYDFPNSKSQKNADIRDLESMKRLYDNNLPLFVVLGSAGNKSLNLGWIKSINTLSKEWIISFSDELVEIEKIYEEENITELFDKDRKKTKTTGTVRPNAREFRDSVIKRYGLSCCFCDIERKEILEAAHIIPYAKNGIDHPENGLLLCRNHHRLLDNGLVKINPETLEVESVEELNSIGITRSSINHLDKFPGTPFLQWLYKKYSN